MAYRSVYCYAWDIAELGVRSVADELQAIRINTITLAGSYHAGKFLRPHGTKGKVFFPEDGTAYFKTDPSRYGMIRPQENSLLASADIFEEFCKLESMKVNAWMVLMHNSLLGQRHLDCCVANAFGDRYIYNLCPASSAAREYAVSLCADLSDRYEVDGITLETPGFLPFAHGYHHEFSLVRQNTWLDNLLGICFCDACLNGAAVAGIDAKSLRKRVAKAIEGYFASDIDFADDMASAFWTADLVTDPDLCAFFRWRCSVVESLIEDIRQAVRPDATVSVIPSVARPTGGAWYEGSDIARLSQIADFVEVCFYEPGPDRIAGDIHDVSRRCGGVDKLRGILRPGHPDLTDRGQVVSAVQTLVAAGIEDIAFYNYGHVRRSGLEWIGDALSSLEARG